MKNLKIKNQHNCQTKSLVWQLCWWIKDSNLYEWKILREHINTVIVNSINRHISKKWEPHKEREIEKELITIYKD